MSIPKDKTMFALVSAGLVGLALGIILMLVLPGILSVINQKIDSMGFFGISKSEALSRAKIALENEKMEIPENAVLTVSEIVNKDTGLPEVLVKYFWTEKTPAQTIEIDENVTEQIPEIEIPMVVMAVVDKKSGETKDILIST